MATMKEGDKVSREWTDTLGRNHRANGYVSAVSGDVLVIRWWATGRRGGKYTNAETWTAEACQRYGVKLAS